MKQDRCSLCGYCNSNCPVFQVVRKEAVSPRGFAILEKKEMLDKVFYACTLCNACKEKCVINIDLKLRKVRQLLIEKGLETRAGKKMIENIRKFGNPYGDEPVEEVYY